MKINLWAVFMFLTLIGSVGEAWDAKTLMCNNLESITLILDPEPRIAWLRMKAKASEGGKIYTHKIIGDNYDIRSTLIMREVKECKKLKFEYDHQYRNASELILKGLDITANNP